MEMLPGPCTPAPRAHSQSSRCSKCIYYKNKSCDINTFKFRICSTHSCSAALFQCRHSAQLCTPPGGRGRTSHGRPPRPSELQRPQVRLGQGCPAGLEEPHATSRAASARQLGTSNSTPEARLRPPGHECSQPHLSLQPHRKCPLTQGGPRGRLRSAPSLFWGPRIPMLRAGSTHARLRAGRPSARSLAALGHVPEELLPLLIAEALQAVRALKVPLASLGCSGAPALCGEFWPLGSHPRPAATGCHKLRSTGL